MFKTVCFAVLVSASLARSDSQRGDWYERYSGDTLNYDSPAEAQVHVGPGQSSGHWRDAYQPAKKLETSSRETGIFQKVRDGLTGAGNTFFGSLRKLSGGSQGPVAEDRMSSPDADPFIDLDADFNIGHPSLGYIGNGFHLRSAAAKGSATKSKRQFDLQGEATQQVYASQGPEASRSYPTGYSYQTSFAGTPRPQRDAPASHYQESFYEYREPSHQGFIPVNQPGHYPEAPPDYAASYYVPDEAAYQPQPQQPQQPQFEGQYEETVTKPPLHVKIQQDLGNLVNGIVAPIKNLMPKIKTPSETPSDPSSSYQLVASPPVHQPVDNYLEPNAYDDNEVAHRYEAEPVSSSGLFSTPYGKPPLLEKIKQDFFYWLPKSKREVKYAAAPQPQPQPEPLAYPQYPSESLPAKNHQVRQVSVPSGPSLPPPQAPAFISSTGGSDNSVLFKIIPVETNGAAPLYQIVPSGPSSTLVGQPTVVASHISNVPKVPTLTGTHDQPIQLTSAPASQYQYYHQQHEAPQHHHLQQQQQHYEQPSPAPQPHFSQRHQASDLRSSDVDPLRAATHEADDDFFAKVVAEADVDGDYPEEAQTSRSGKAVDPVHYLSSPDFSRETGPSEIVQMEGEEPDAVPNVIHSYQVDMFTKNSMDPLFVSSKALGDEDFFEEELS